MRLNDERVEELQVLLKELYGLDLSAEQTQGAGLSILRFVLAKTQRQQELSKTRSNDMNQESLRR